MQINHLDRDFRTRIIAIHAYAKANPNDPIRTDHFKYQSARGELYFVSDDTGPLKVDRDSYVEFERLRHLMEQELAIQLQFNKSSLPPQAEEMREEVEQLSASFQRTWFRLEPIGCRLQVGRDRSIAIVKANDHPQPEEDKNESEGQNEN